MRLRGPSGRRASGPCSTRRRWVGGCTCANRINKALSQSRWAEADQRVRRGAEGRLVGVCVCVLLLHHDDQRQPDVHVNLLNGYEGMAPEQYVPAVVIALVCCLARRRARRYGSRAPRRMLGTLHSSALRSAAPTHALGTLLLPRCWACPPACLCACIPRRRPCELGFEHVCVRAWLVGAGTCWWAASCRSTAGCSPPTRPSPRPSRSHACASRVSEGGDRSAVGPCCLLLLTLTLHVHGGGLP